MLIVTEMPGCCGAAVLHGLSGSTSAQIKTKLKGLSNKAQVIATAVTEAQASALEGAGFSIAARGYNPNSANNVGTFIFAPKAARSTAANAMAIPAMAKVSR